MYSLYIIFFTIELLTKKRRLNGELPWPIFVLRLRGIFLSNLMDKRNDKTNVFLLKRICKNNTKDALPPPKNNNVGTKVKFGPNGN